MSKSLQEQLLKAGLGNEKKLKAIKKKSIKNGCKPEKMAQSSMKPQCSPNKARQQQLQRDQELNRQRKAELDKKALAAQVKQLIELNTITHKGETAFNFTDGSVVKRLYVSNRIHAELTKGQAAIAKLAEQYYVIPVKVAKKFSNVWLKPS